MLTTFSPLLSIPPEGGREIFFACRTWGWKRVLKHSKTLQYSWSWLPGHGEIQAACSETHICTGSWCDVSDKVTEGSSPVVAWTTPVMLGFSHCIGSPWAGHQAGWNGFLTLHQTSKLALQQPPASSSLPGPSHHHGHQPDTLPTPGPRPATQTCASPCLSSISVWAMRINLGPALCGASLPWPWQSLLLRVPYPLPDLLWVPSVPMHALSFSSHHLLPSPPLPSRSSHTPQM